MDIKNEVVNCHKCGDLKKLVEPLVQTGNTPFMIIGESPAKDGWIRSKRAFYNVRGQLQATGKVLQKLLNGIGYSIEDIYFTECCKCIIEDRKRLEKCAQNCMPILSEQLKELPCKMIVSMGLHARRLS